MRILYLSQYFPPEMGAPAARVSELATRWAAEGHDVTVLTAFPHHPTGIVPPEYRRRILACEKYEGVDVVRSYVYATPNKGVFRRALSFASFALSSLTIGANATPARRVDVVVATSPQFFCAVAGFIISRLKGVPFVLEIRDLWPESIVAVGLLRRDSVPHRILRATELFLYRAASLLVSVTDSFVETWVDQGIERKKIRVVKNGVDLERFRPRDRDNPFRSELGLEGKFLVTYVGTHGMAQGLATLVETADLVKDDPRFHFLLVGEGAEKADVMRLAGERGLENMTFLGQQPRDRIPEIIAASDLVAVILRKRELFKHVIPSKIFEIMACERPILLGVRGEAERIVAASGSGYMAEPDDPASMAEQIRLAGADPAGAALRGKAGREFVAREFDRNDLAARYAGYITSVVRSGGD